MGWQICDEKVDWHRRFSSCFLEIPEFPGSDLEIEARAFGNSRISDLEIKARCLLEIPKFPGSGNHVIHFFRHKSASPCSLLQPS